MKSSIKVIALFLALAAGMAQAGEPVLEVGVSKDDAIFQSSGQSVYPSYILAQADTGAKSATASNAAVAVQPAAEFKEPIFTLNKTHKFLGVSTIVAAAATMMTAPGEGCETNCPPASQQPPRNRTGTHAKLARATVALATATVITGIIAHWDDIHLDNGITDPDNLHALLGLTGVLLMEQAVNKSAGSAVPVSHAGEAELGALLMVAGIKMVW
jgi:hypothetical protein